MAKVVTTEEKKKALAQAVANAAAQGGRAESMTEEQAVIAYDRVSAGRLIVCLLIWWPGFFFGHHRSLKRQIVRIDDYGNTLLTDV